MTTTPMTPGREQRIRSLLEGPVAELMANGYTAVHPLLGEVDRLRARVAELESAQETEAHPAKTQWAVEIYDPRHSMWVAPTRFHAPEVAADAMKDYEKSTPTWSDGSPVQQRIVRETTTYTVEPAPAVAEEPTP